MNVLFLAEVCECLWAWVKMFVKLSFYSMVYPSTRSFVIIQFCVCFCPSVCLPVLVLSVYVSVRVFVCMHIFCEMCLLFYRFVCFLSVRSSVRSSVHPPVLSSVCQFECKFLRLVHVCMSVIVFISNPNFYTVKYFCPPIGLMSVCVSVRPAI